LKRLPLWLRAALLSAGALGVAVALRFLVVEPPEFAWTCQSLTPPWWCPLRTAAIVALRAGAAGFLALALSLWAIVRRSRPAALAALAVGAAGLVLYVPEPAAGGVLLGALALLRR
jgi:hypothetical protein